MDSILLCFVTLFSLFSHALGEGFWNVRLNPQSVAVIPFHAAHISVWEHATIPGRYFASPLVCIQPETAQTFHNFLTGKSQVNFRVLLWSVEAKEAVYDYLRSRVNASTIRDDVELLPMERIRVVWKDRQQPLPEYYQVDTEWQPNNHLPTAVTFHILCADQDRCTTLEAGMKTTPEAFHGLRFEYEINAQKTATRRLVVKGEHLVGGQLYSRLVNMPVQTGVRFLSSRDVTRLATQTITNVLATVTTDEDYVDEDDEVSVTNMLRTVLQRQTVSTETFTPRMWDSVFWSEDAARPDKLVHYMNRVLTVNGTSNTSHLLLNQSARDLAAETGFGISNFFTGVGSGASSGSASTVRKEDVVNTVQHRHSHVEWSEDRESFVVRPMTLTRLNLATLNQTITIVSTQVQLRRLDSVKSMKLCARCGTDILTTKLTNGIKASQLDRKLDTILNTTVSTELRISKLEIMTKMLANLTRETNLKPRTGNLETRQVATNISRHILNALRGIPWPEYCGIGRHSCGGVLTYYYRTTLSLHNCGRKCSRDARCKSFDHYWGGWSGKNCYLYDANCVPEYCYIDGHNCGGTLTYFSSAGRLYSHECRRMCDRDARCKSFDYSRRLFINDNNCYLYDSNCQPDSSSSSYWRLYGNYQKMRRSSVTSLLKVVTIGNIKYPSSQNDICSRIGRKRY